MSDLSINRRRFGLLLGQWAVWPAVLNAGPSASARVRVAVGGRGALCYLPLIVAQTLGFFRQEGLDVWLQDYRGGALALQAVSQGQADVCCGAFEHVFAPQPQGDSLQSLALLGRTPQLALAVAAGHRPLESAADFRGLRVGVVAPDSSSQFFASLWLGQSGVALEDVSFVGVGMGSSALAALRGGRVQALCHPEPVMTLLERRGEVRLLADARTLAGSREIFGGSMPGACLYAPRTFVQRQPQQAQALVNALVRSLKWLQTASPADLVRVAPPPFLLGDRGAYLAALDKVRESFSPDGLMPGDGPATALRAAARVQPELASAGVDLPKTFSNGWVDKAKIKFQM